MGKRKSNMQKREIAAKQKLNKARKAEKLRQVLKRNFDDMTPLPQWEIKRYLAWVDSVKKSHILSVIFQICGPPLNGILTGITNELRLMKNI